MDKLKQANGLGFNTGFGVGCIAVLFGGLLREVMMAKMEYQVLVVTFLCLTPMVLLLLYINRKRLKSLN